MALKLRPFQPETDYPRLLELFNSYRTIPVTEERLRAEEGQQAPGYRLDRVVAIHPGGEIVAMAQVLQQPLWNPGEFAILVVVDPAERRQGIGSQLIEVVRDRALALGATRLRAQVPDTDPAWRRFAERHGFQIERHTFQSTLDLAAFDESPYRGHAESIKASGIRFFSLAELEVTPVIEQRHFDFTLRTLRDIPGWQAVVPRLPTLEEHLRLYFDPLYYRADGQIVTADGERWVGLTVLWYLDASKAFNAYTGVDRDYRGRGIALALKLQAIHAARRLSASSITTNNDSQNSPILALNRKLGYRPQAGNYLMVTH